MGARSRGDVLTDPISISLMGRLSFPGSVVKSALHQPGSGDANCSARILGAYRHPVPDIVEVVTMSVGVAGAADACLRDLHHVVQIG